MNIYEKLSAIQQELKAPKNQFNKFGGYNYRNCEDILEAVKPICAKYKAVLIVSDSIENIGDRFYVKATATLYNAEKSEEYITASAFAREEESKKGMDGSQVTGASSSYARKYSLNGLFNIDDTKDADTLNGMQKETPKKPQLTPLKEELNKLSSDVAKKMNTTAKLVYAGALQELNVKGDTEAEQSLVINYLKGILKNAT